MLPAPGAPSNMNHPRIIKTGVRLAVAAVTTAGVLVPTAALATPPAPADPDTSTTLAGKTVFLDPGHQGSDHSQDLARQVNDGRGGTKDCQTTGMTTRNGIAEHTINWNVAQLVSQSLQSLGAHVVLSRQDDTGWGGCVDERAEAANRSGADVALSIHADGAPEQDHGFHLIVPQLPIPAAAADRAQSGPGRAATQAVRDAYVQAGFAPANYAGAVDGLQTRSDIAGPALTQVPDVFVEMGNGANADDAKLLESQDGQLQHAIAITTGLVGYLLGVDPGAATSQASAPADAPVRAPDPSPSQPPTPPGQTSPTEDPASPTHDQASPAPGSTSADSQAPTPSPADSLRGAPTPKPGASAQQNPSTPETTRPAQSGTPATTQPSTDGTRDPAAQTRPGNPASASSDTYRSAPGTSPSTTPQARTSPQADAQALPGRSGNDAQQSTPETGSAAGEVATTAMKLLLPLAKSLGIDEGAMSDELVNLAYTLASTLLEAIE